MQRINLNMYLFSRLMVEELMNGGWMCNGIDHQGY